MLGLRLLSACLSKKNLKIEKVLSLMRHYRDMPGAMHEDLMAKVEAAFLQTTPENQELCHA